MLEGETGHSLKNQVTITKLETGYLVDGRHAFSDLGEVFDFVDEYFEDGTLNAKTSKPNTDDWIEWHGGERPVDGDTKVQLRFKDGLESLSDEWGARIWNWHHKGTADDIIAYRVVSE